MNTLLLEHLAAVSKIAAYRQAREHQEGVDASQGYLTTNAAGVLFEGPRTFVCHFKYEVSSRLQGIAGFTVPMMALEIAPSTNLLRFYCSTTSATAPIVPRNNYQAVISYDGTTAVCYLNGSEAARFTVAGYAVTNVFRIGNPSYPPVGPVYSSSHFNYALSAEEVSAQWNNGDPAAYVLPAVYKYRWEASESDIKKISFYPNNTGAGVASYLEDNANGFSGRYAHIVPGDSGALSVYNSPFGGHPVGCVVESKFKYRSNAPVLVWTDNSNLPINMEDAADVTIVYRTTGTRIIGFSVSVPNADANSWVEIQPVSLRTIGCVAEYLPQNLVANNNGLVSSWLDSAKQLPLNDEYLPPLLETAGGYDLTANGTPEIIYK